MNLKNKVVLVTGGSQGIGESVALALGAAGAQVAVVASRSFDKAQAVAQAVVAAGGQAQGFVCDVRDPAAAQRVVDDVVARFGHVDMLVNAAGVFMPSPAGQTAPATVDDMVDINLKGAWNMVNAVVPRMKEAGRGKIVNFASVAGVTGIGGYAVYCATKAGIVMMTRALASELGRLGINVNCIAPGNTETQMNAALRTDPAMQEAREVIASRTPSTRVFSQPADIAGGVLFLLSDAGNAMHGACLLMDEGISAGL